MLMNKTVYYLNLIDLQVMDIWNMINFKYGHLKHD